MMASVETTAEQQTRRAPGRPREFDRGEALRAAMLVFWRYGYDGASLTLLTEAMGVSKPTLYAAFGDKAALFREAVTDYGGLKADAYEAAFALPTARATVEAWLRLASGVEWLPETPTGCLLLRGAMLDGGLGAGSGELRGEVVAILLAATGRLKERLERGQREGDVAAGVDAGKLADYLSALAAGMAVQSACGVGTEALRRVVDVAMENWKW